MGLRSRPGHRKYCTKGRLTNTNKALYDALSLFWMHHFSFQLKKQNKTDSHLMDIHFTFCWAGYQISQVHIYHDLSHSSPVSFIRSGARKSNGGRYEFSH